MKKIPMIVLLLAPYLFLLAFLLICYTEGGFTAKALNGIAGIYLGLMIVGMMLIPFLVIFDYSLLLSSSMYGISGIWGLAGAGKFSAAGAVFLSVCQLMFVADVVCAVYLYCRFGKRFG